MWVWVKIKPGDRSFWSMFPLPRLPLLGTAMFDQPCVWVKSFPLFRESGLGKLGFADSFGASGLWVGRGGIPCWTATFSSGALKEADLAPTSRSTMQLRPQFLVPGGRTQLPTRVKYTEHGQSAADSKALKRNKNNGWTQRASCLRPSALQSKLLSCAMNLRFPTPTPPQKPGEKTLKNRRIKN